MAVVDSSGVNPRPSRTFVGNILSPVLRLLNRRTIPLLAILFIAGLAGAMINMSRLSSDLIQSQAVQSSALYAQAIKEARTLYSNNAIAPLKQVHPDVAVTPEYANLPGAVPLPATFLIELSQSISRQNPGMSVRLYSDYPFRWRQQDGGPQDDFEQAALTYLRQHPNETFVRFEEFRGRSALRYAEADIMKPSCVACHNTHPDSPKRDWKEGDVRGILEITRPLDSFIAQTQTGLRGTFMMLGGLLLLALLGIGIVMSRLRQTSRELELRVAERTAQLRQANEQLLVEQEKSERLLLNILPEPIAHQLKEGQNNIADGFAEATILFCDLVGFTKLSERMHPTQLISLLNEIFSQFDRLTEKHGLEKIKTIGDAYMVVGGLPVPRADHAEAIAEMALDMQAEIRRFNQRRRQQCDIRIGINTGPVVAGVIGTKKFIYDLWGDTVNVASRMESHGVEGEIQVTASTYEQLKHRYTFQSRGSITVKDKGEMVTYLLTGRKAKREMVSLTKF
ncbi:adenylate/guanylate cyclase domain-containing protein [Leptolyngbya ohadii]|uniref:adenylate/guanylate cyclase domain-containing protein n=1 Tax=Leptolyngbya ohadii TaxID=1962290 RepID=UPI000B59A38D|nr:adenylate/guanylate cyclase domain-containing protein [Leptolyngbya ohadii]